MTIELAQMLMAILLIAVMAAGFGVAWLAVRGRQRLRELAYQERIAMIEKGLVPSPETDPAGFEAMLTRHRPSVRSVRYRTAGVIITGFGLALTVLIFFVVPEIRGIALGVGGSFTVLGLTILANSLLLAADDTEGNSRSMGARG